MAKTRGALGIVSLILLAAALLFMFFIVLSGYKNITPLNKTYFLQADTSMISGARSISQWTYFYICGEGNMDCGNAVPALPFGAPWVGGGSGAPESLIGSHYKGTTSTYFYYMWRFGWVFYLIAMLFTAMAFLFSMIAPCTRLGSGVAGLVASMGLFFMSLAAALMTATFVRARNVFRAAGMNATLGRYAFGWTWGAWFALFLATMMLCMGALGRKDGGDHVRSTNGHSSGGYFRRNKSRKSTRGSFIDNESQRRVKDEYA